MTNTFWTRFLIATGIATTFEHVYAQSSSVPSICSNSATTTLTKSTDATAVGSACPTYYGSIAVGGPNAKEDISLGGMLTIVGDLTISPIDTSSTISMTSDHDLNVTGNVVANGATMSNSITFSTVGGDFFENDCEWGSSYYYYQPPAGTPIDLNANVAISKGDRVAAYFKYTSSEASSGARVDIQNAPNLTYVELAGYFDGHLTTLNNNLTYSTVTLESEVTGVASLNLANITGLSADYLINVNDFFNVSGSTFDTLYLKALIAVSGAFILKDNNIQALNLPNLASIDGDLMLVNNLFSTTAGFYVLEDVSGNVVLDGSFDDVTFPKFSSVGGDMTINSTLSLSCEQAAGRYVASSARVVNGTFVCTSANETSTLIVQKGQAYNSTTGSVTTPSSVSSSSSGASGSSKTAIGVGVGVGVGVALILIGILAWFLLRRRKVAKPSAKMPDSDDAEDMTYMKAELSSDTQTQPHYEMADGNAIIPGRYEAYGKPVAPPQELQGSTGAAEVMSKRDADASYPGTFVGSEWRVEAPGDSTWANNKPSSIAASGTGETATAHPIASISGQPARMVSIRSSSQSQVSPTRDSNAAGSGPISPVSSSGRLSHLNGGLSPLVPPKSSAAYKLQVSGGTSATHSLEPPRETQQLLEHKPSVSSLAPSEAAARAEENASLMAEEELRPERHP